MKAHHVVLALSLMVLVGACNKPASMYTESLKDLYPNASFVDWDYDDGYQTAEFRQNGLKTKVWFDVNGTWVKKEIDYTHKMSKLPQVVRDAFNQSAYASSKVEDIDFVEYASGVSYYEFDLENTNDIIIYPDGRVEIVRFD